MATTKKRVQGYVSPRIADVLEEYQSEHGLNQSQALEQILRRFFAQSFPNADPGESDQQEKMNRLTETVQSLERSLAQLERRVEVIDEEIVGQKDVNEMIWKDIQELYPPATLETQPMTAAEKEQAIEAVISHVNNGGSDSGSDDDLPILKALAAYIDPVEAPEPEPEPVQPEPEPEPEAEVEAEPDPNVRKLSHAGLAKRLGISEPTLSKHRKSGNFENWVRNKDLQGIPWQYDPVARVYLGKLPS